MPYRQDIGSMEERCTTLERELASLRERARELGDVRRQEEEVAHELEAARKMLGDRRALPLLDNVRVASPCTASWDAMKGDERVRFCGQCEKNVYNLSAMTREEGERLLQEKEGNACVRFYRREDGTLLTTDCPVGARRVRVRRLAMATVGGGLVAAATALGAARSTGRCAVATQGEVATNVPVMGGIGPAPEQPKETPEVKPPPAVMGHMGRVAPRKVPGK
jgi:hypothetical protein